MDSSCSIKIVSTTRVLAELILDVVGKLTVVVGEAVVGVVWEDRPQW